MKIALIAEEHWPYIGGGAGVSSTLLVRQLRKKGISADVYVFDKKSPPILGDMGSTKYYDVIDHRFSPLINLQVIKTLRKKLVEYDLVHVYSAGPGLMAASGFLRRTILKIPVIATLNGFLSACIRYEKWMRLRCTNCSVSGAILCASKRSKETQMFVPGPVLATYFIIQRLFSRSLDRYFALSDTIKKMYMSAGFPEDKVTVIPNMYDSTFLKKLEQVKAEKSNDKIVILYVGQLRRHKGVEDLIKAFFKVGSQKAELWIVGHGPEEKRLRDLANKIKEEKKIRFFGFIPYSDIPTMYRKADIFVHPGKWPEPFGRTIAEAMLSRLPVVASDSGAPPQILGNSGLVFRTGNVSELKRSLEILIENKNLRESLGQKAYNKCMKDYSPDVITKRILKEYKNLVT